MSTTRSVEECGVILNFFVAAAGLASNAFSSFSSLDINGDGRLTLDEVNANLAHDNAAVSPKVWGLFNVGFVDGSDLIDRPEHLGKKYKHLLVNLDPAEVDGVLTPGEWDSLPPSLVKLLSTEQDGGNTVLVIDPEYEDFVDGVIAEQLERSQMLRAHEEQELANQRADILSSMGRAAVAGIAVAGAVAGANNAHNDDQGIVAGAVAGANNEDVDSDTTDYSSGEDDVSFTFPTLRF